MFELATYLEYNEDILDIDVHLPGDLTAFVSVIVRHKEVMHHFFIYHPSTILEIFIGCCLLLAL